MSRGPLLRLMLLVGLGALVAGCVVEPAPVAGCAWIPGHYNGWQWVPGHCR